MVLESISTDRVRVITIASNDKVSNRLCNMAWERGEIVLTSLIDYRGDNLPNLFESLKYGAEKIYAEDLRILGTTYRKIAENLKEIRRYSIKIVFPDWELDPMREGYEAVLMAFSDLARHDGEERGKLISKGMKEAKHSPPRVSKRPLPYKQIAEMRVKNLGWNTIATKLDIPRTTLLQRRKDIDAYMKTHGYYDRLRRL